MGSQSAPDTSGSATTTRILVQTHSGRADPDKAVLRDAEATTGHMTQTETQSAFPQTTKRRPRLEIATSGMLATTLGLLLAGLLLAMTGIHHVWLQAPLATVLALVIYRLLPRAPTTEPLGRSVAIILVVLIATAIVTNFVMRSELIIAGRDGGTYANTASFLVDEGGLFPAAVEEPFIGTDLEFGGPGFVPRDDGTFWQQFLHASPATYAFFGEIFGKSALFAVNAFLSGVGVLAVFALASRFMTAWWALLSAAITAFSLPFVYYSRGTFSEMAALILTMGGLWVGHIALTTSPRLGLGAGLLLGGATVVRVDAWMGGVALGLLFVSVTWMRDREATGVVGTIFSGFVTVAALGLVDLVFFSEPYLAIVGKSLLPLVIVTAFLRLIATVANSPLFQRLLTAYVAHRAFVINVATAGFVGLLAFLWFGRSLLPPAVAPGVYGIDALQIVEGLPIEPTRAYTELSVWWLVWYLGLPITTIGFIGATGAIRRALQPGSAALRLVVLSFIVPALTYFFRPSVNPDQIWAMRRFLPVVIPVLVIAAVVTLAGWVQRASESPKARFIAAPAGRIAVVLVAVIPVLLTTAPLMLEPDRGGLEQQMVALCDRLGDSRSVLIINDDPEVPLSGRIGPPLRSWCHLSVAGIAAGDDIDVTADVIIAPDPNLLPSPPEASHEFVAEAWQSRLTGAPSTTVNLSLVLWIDMDGS